MTIDRPEATIRDQLLLTVTVDGSRSAVPELPDLPDFQVYSRGQSSQIQMGGGRTNVTVSHSFLLVPRRTGTFTIGPATVEIDGRTYRSQPFRVKILEATAEPREAQEAYVTARVSNPNPYVGEQVSPGRRRGCGRRWRRWRRGSHHRYVTDVLG